LQSVLLLAAGQQDLVTHEQLLDLGMSRGGIKHRIARGKLHPIYRGVYAIGRPKLTAMGRWMAALLACGPGAVLSHDSAAAFWRLGPRDRKPEVTICPPRRVRVSGITIHCSRAMPDEHVIHRNGVAATTVLRTLVDLAPRWGEQRIEDAIEAADRWDLADPESLAAALSTCPTVPGTATVRKVLNRWTLTLTDTQLERAAHSVSMRSRTSPDWSATSVRSTRS
jgi:hypothetical protein